MMSPDANSRDLERLPPHDFEAETAVLGGLIRNNDTIHDVIGKVSPDDFFKESNKLVFSAVLRLYEDDRPFDLITVKNQLEKDGSLARSDAGRLIELLDTTSSVTNVKFYADIVKEKSRLRALINAGHEIIAGCYQTELDSADIIDRVEQQVFRLSEHVAGVGLDHVEIAVNSAYEELKDIYTHGVSGLSSGFSALDNKTTGFHEGELIIIAGRPSMGKTTFAMNIAAYIAKNHERFHTAVLVFSLEMAKSQLAIRLLGTESGIAGNRLRKGELNQDDWDRIIDSTAAISQWPLYIDDTPDISVLEMRSVARRLATRIPIGLILVDYIQLIRADRQSDSRQMEISQISRSLKFLAKEMKCPVLALSQLSRAVENRAIKRPQLADLRESGAIEQDADVVLMLYRPWYYEEKVIKINNREQSSEGLAEIIISKQRNGPVGSFYLGFQDALMQFINIDTFAEVPYDVADD
ncbi:replicative DNA helicase [bacterium]|nr:replicative DNA helicase [candidate division CSSED10-310 bacterium]